MSEREEHREPPGQTPVTANTPEHGSDERRDGADREVDVPRDDDHHHADGENEDVAVLHDEVRDVLRAQQDAVR